MKNKYYNRSRISEAKFRDVVKYFSLDIDATKTAKVTNLNRNTINKKEEGLLKKRQFSGF